MLKTIELSKVLILKVSRTNDNNIIKVVSSDKNNEKVVDLSKFEKLKTRNPKIWGIYQILKLQKNLFSLPLMLRKPSTN